MGWHLEVWPARGRRMKRDGLMQNPKTEISALDRMPKSFLAAFQSALNRTADWMGPAAGNEPQCYLEDKPYSVGTFFELMTPFVNDRLNDLDHWLVQKILGGARESE